MDLKPCPFCGGPARMSTRQDESLWSHNVVTHTAVGCGECDYSFSSEPGYEIEAPDRWNTRAMIAAAPDAPEGMEEGVSGAERESSGTSPTHPQGELSDGGREP